LDTFQNGWVVLALALLASLFFTAFIRKILKNANISDSPIVTEHRHKAGTPTMGGLGMLMAVLFVASVYYKNSYLIITCFIMMTAGLVGLLDDLIGLKVKELQKIVKNISSSPVQIGQLTLKPGEEARAATEKAKKDLNGLLKSGQVEVVGEAPIKSEVKESEKILAQFIIALFLVATGAITTIGGFSLGLLVIPIVIIGIIGAINAVNLIDGMDGLAAGIIAIASASCAIFLNLNGDLTSSVPFIALTGLTLGFLVFNRYPASIFMGDTGSFALGGGYAAAVMLTDTVYFGVLALAVPIISVVISLMHRSHIIKLPVEPLHHTLHYKGLSEKKIVLIYWGVTLLVCIFGLYFYQYFPK
jgi:phospho-N-acetylmuramoyl-pentapeptide-transferase